MPAPVVKQAFIVLEEAFLVAMDQVVSLTSFAPVFDE